MKAMIASAFAATALLAAPVFSDDHAKDKDAKKDIVTTAVVADDFTTLVAAVAAADLVDTLMGEGPFTVFAPTDAAFAALPSGTLGTLLEEEGRGTLTTILTYHVVPGKVMAADLAGAVTTVETAAGIEITIDGTDGVKIGDVSVVTADVETSNGVIHIVDGVLLPPTPDTH